MNQGKVLKNIRMTARDGRTELDLSNNNLTYLPAEIGQLKNLTKLDLDSNNLTALPAEIGQLKNLTELNLRNNNLTSLPAEICQLKNLTELYLGNNKLISLPAEIGQLKNLTTLYLSDNKLTSLPAEIGQLENLTILTLFKNELTSLPAEIGQLKNLTELWLGDNNLTSLPAEIGQSKNLTTLDLSYNPIKLPPPEIVKEGVEAIRNYFEELEAQGEEYVYEAKLIIVGEPGAGKTSLAQKLQNPDYELNPDESMTKGIKVEKWHFPYNKEISFQSNIWDFGGQDIMHCVHRYFLTERSLYIVMADNRKEDTDFYYWLNMVEMLSSKSPILVVLNEKYKYKKFIPEGILKSFDTIEKVCNVDLADNTGLEDLSKTIRKQLTNLPHIGAEPIPKKWVLIRNVLENDTRDCIDYPTYLDICKQNGIKDEKKGLHISKFLHDLGVLLHFQNDRLLKNIIILNNTWATEAVYMLLMDNTIIENSGEFDNGDFERVWDVPEYKNKCHHLLQLMINFELCYEIDNRQKYIIPELLSEKPPDGIPSEFKEADNLLQFRYTYTFMPKGIISRLIVRMHKHIHNGLQWKNGVILQIGGATAEIVEYFHQKLLKIRICGETKPEALAVIRHYVNDLHDTFENLDYDEMIPCICDECINSNEPFFYKYGLLKKYEDNNIEEIRCETSLVNVIVLSLMKGIFPPEEAEDHEGVNMKFGDIHFHDKSRGFLGDTVNYNENIGITKEEFEQLKNAIEKLSNDKQSELSKMSKELTGTVAEKRPPIIEKMRNFLNDNGIPIAQSLAATAIFELARIFAG